MNKKLLKSFFAVIVAVAGVFAFSTSAQAAVIGDVNNDGSVTAADVTAIYDVLLGNDLMFQATADVNNDGSVTAADVTFVYDILLGNVQPSYEKVYILGDVNGNEWNASNGVEMTTQDGKIYTAAITTKETGFSYFSFTTKLANPDTEFNAAWDEIAPYRFGAVPSDDYNFVVTEELLGTEIALTTEEGFQALQMAPGSFNLSLDLENMKLTITGEFAPQPEPAGNWYLVGTCNGWSTTDMGYQFTQSTENPNLYSIFIEPVIGDYWFKIANEDCFTATNFWSGTILSFAVNGVNPLSGNLVQGNEGAFCLPANYNATYFDLTIDVENFTYEITTDGQEPQIDPNAEYDYLYIAGDADGWSGNGGKVASVKGENDYYGFFYAGSKFKFQKFQGDWGTNWGGSNGTLVSGGADISASGFVYVNANLNNMTYSITNITSIGVIGDATPGGLVTETALTYNQTSGAWEGQVTFTTGEFEFRVNGDEDFCFGGALDKLVLNGSNINVQAGTYNVVLTLVCPGEYSATLTPVN